MIMEKFHMLILVKDINLYYKIYKFLIMLYSFFYYIGKIKHLNEI